MNAQETKELNEIIMYENDDNSLQIEVRSDGDTVWLSQAQLVELYNGSKANISEHIKHIYKENELDRSSTVRKFRTVRAEGNRDVMREI
jgi:hypothetical protein